MPLESGQRLLHYRLIDKIGEGGMGVVWRAEDTTLQREVAIKILPEGVAADPKRLARFEREARLLATLNHPNIAAVYGFHEAEGAHFLAMELVRGEDLSERVRRGALPVDEALEIAGAIAEALRSAHAAGVIHRDLKPANIRLGPDGEVKVLDFGLAKALSADSEASGSGVSAELSPTVTSLGTVVGVLLGTAAYMSPEQARGKPVDRRADIWAFGCVLFEMLTGRLLFVGETITDTLAAVVRAEPDWDSLPADLPRGARRVLRLCLAKNPRERLHDIADATLLMGGDVEEEAGPASMSSPEDSKRSRVRERLAWTVAALALVGLIVTAFVFGRQSDGAADAGPPTRFTIRLPGNEPLFFTDSPILAFSPDGRMIAFVALDSEAARPIIYVRAMDQADPWPLPGTEGGTSPFFSPDGAHIAFFADGVLKRISLGGGSPITLADAATQRGGTWLPDDTIIYSPEYASGLWQISASGGAPKEVVGPDIEAGERTFRWPTVLPDGKHVLFTVGSTESPNNYDQASIAAFSLEDGTRHTLLEGGSMARFVPPSSLVFSRAGVLYGVEFDPDTIEPVGTPVRLKNGVGGDPSSGASFFDVSSKGDLTYVSGTITGARSNLVLVERDGSSAAIPLDPRGFNHPDFAPDGSRLAFSVGDGPQAIGDIWVYSFGDGALRRVTFDGSDLYPLWHPDGTRLTFVRASDVTMVSKAADGSGDIETIAKPSNNTEFPGSWAPDMSKLAITRTGRTTDIYLLTPGEQTPQVFATDASAPAISPNGRWLAYQSPASGNATAFVKAIDGEGQWQASPDMGAYPRWSPDGRKLFYIDSGSPTRPLMEVDVAADEVFRAGMPRVVIADTTRFVTSTAPLINWDTDGDRFIFVEMLRDEKTLFRIEVTLDWSRQVLLAASP